MVYKFSPSAIMVGGFGGPKAENYNTAHTIYKKKSAPYLKRSSYLRFVLIFALCFYVLNFSDRSLLIGWLVLLALWQTFTDRVAWCGCGWVYGTDSKSVSQPRQQIRE